MAEIQNINGQTVIDYMARDYDSLLQALRERIPELMPAWTDYESEADFGNVLLQLVAHLGDILSYYQDRIANESFLGTAQSRRSIIHHLRLIGYRLGAAAPASTNLTLLAPVPAPPESKVTIKIVQGDAFATRSLRDRASVRFEYAGAADLIIDFDAGSPVTTDPKTNQKYHYYGLDPFAKGPGQLGIPVEEGRLV